MPQLRHATFSVHFAGSLPAIPRGTRLRRPCAEAPPPNSSVAPRRPSPSRNSSNSASIPSKNPAAAVASNRRFPAQHKEVVAIATCRRKAYGGSFNGSLAEEIAILTAAADAGFGLVDLEIESAEAVPHEKNWTNLREGAAASSSAFTTLSPRCDPEAFRANSAV
jgi:hypothetical protein